ncbi:MAG: hypothetical protein QM817_03800 [Archangium sp.]
MSKLLLISVAASLLVVGCRHEPSQATPELAYRTFVDFLQKGQARLAWNLLSAPTREKVTAKSKAIAEASKGQVRDEPETLLFQGSRPAAITAINQVRADDSTATLEVTSGTGTYEVKLVKDSGRWLVDLSDTL